MDNEEIENATGVRFSWNLWPANKEQALDVEMPLGCLYAPLKKCKGMPTVSYEPVRCRQSGCILNPYCHVDLRSKVWSCPITGQRNAFPPSYTEYMTENNLPPELLSPTVEYIIPQSACLLPAYIFVVDTCMIEEEIDSLKDCLQQALNLINPESYIGLITFSKMVYVHDLSSNDCPKAYVYQGSRIYTDQEIHSQLGLSIRNDPRGAVGCGGQRKFVMTLNECDFVLNTILDNLVKDDFPVGGDCRPSRCVGTALHVALSLAENVCANQSTRIMLFASGCCTLGPGLIVEPQLSENIRHHRDILKSTTIARHVHKANEYYLQIAKRAAKAGFAIDLCLGSLDQCGLYEMKVVADKTGGYIIMADCFSMSAFTESFKKIFDTDEQGCLNQGFNCKMEVLCSKEVKVCGCIGACNSLEKKAPHVGDIAVGETNTCLWGMGSVDINTHFAFYFDIVPTEKDPSNSSQAFVQFQTLFQHSSGRRHLRVTTVCYKFADPASLDIGRSFDQEAAVVIIARLAIYKTETEETLDVLRWLDRKLIRFSSKFADYQVNDISSFRLQEEFAMYPQFMYHLRRSQFLQTFNASPDETSFYRGIMIREGLQGSLCAIQPVLLEYSYETGGVGQPVLLDVKSLRPDISLLCDSFFHVIIWCGETMQKWKEQKIYDIPEYSYVKNIIEAPHIDAKVIMEGRFPSPKFISTSAGGSQARFLLAKVNPSATHNNQISGGFGSNYDNLNNVVFTDDVALDVFLDHLIKLAVET